MSAQFCKHCHSRMDTEEIKWRIKFLATVLNYLYKMDSRLDEDECSGLMFLLYDIADMICPPGEKGGEA